MDYQIEYGSGDMDHFEVDRAEQIEETVQRVAQEVRQELRLEFLAEVDRERHSELEPEERDRLLAIAEETFLREYYSWCRDRAVAAERQRKEGAVAT